MFIHVYFFWLCWIMKVNLLMVKLLFRGVFEFPLLQGGLIWLKSLSWITIYILQMYGSNDPLPQLWKAKRCKNCHRGIRAGCAKGLQEGDPGSVQERNPPIPDSKPVGSRFKTFQNNPQQKEMFWGASNLAQNVTGIQVTKSLEHSETDPFTMGSFDPYDLTHHGETFQGLRGHMYARVKELRWRWYIIYSIYATLSVWKYDKIWNNAMWIHISMAKNLGSHHTTSRWYGASSILQILSTESSKVLVPATSIVLGRFVSIVGSIAELVGCSHTAVCCWLFIFHHHSNSNTNNKVRLPQGIKHVPSRLVFGSQHPQNHICQDSLYGTCGGRSSFLAEKLAKSWEKIQVFGSSDA